MYVHYMYNTSMKFSWDDKKAELNLRKHKVSFKEASTVFSDPLAKLAFDPDHSKTENRMILIGHSQRSNLLFVVHVCKDEGETIRVISARRATKNEKKDYEQL